MAKKLEEDQYIVGRPTQKLGNQSPPVPTVVAPMLIDRNCDVLKTNHDEHPEAHSVCAHERWFRFRRSTGHFLFLHCRLRCRLYRSLLLGRSTYKIVSVQSNYRQ